MVSTKKAVKKSYRKKYYKKPVPRKSLGVLGFPKMLKVCHKYVSAPAQVNCTLGAMATYIWTCNGMYDPDITSTGHQPLYFDQMALIYDHYTVIGSRIDINVQTSEDPIGPSIGVLWIDDDSGTTATNVSMVSEQGFNPTKNIGGPNHNPSVFFTKSWSAKKTFGGSVIGNNDLQGTAAANPTELSYYKFSYNTIDTSSATLYVTARITYIAVWAELKEMAQS